MTIARYMLLWAAAALLGACDGGPLEPRSINLEPVWVEPGGHLSRPPNAGAGHFIVSACPVAALDPATGAIVWEVTGNCGVRRPPPFTVVGEVVIISASGLHAIDAVTGVTLWIREDAPSGVVAGAGPDGVFSTDGADLVAYDLATGAERWREALEPGGGVNLGAGHGLVCAERLVSAPGDALIECFSTSDGSRQWSRHVGTAAWVVVTPDVVVIAGADREFETGWIGLDPATGETLWIHTGDLPDHGPAISPDGEVVYTCAQPGGTGSDCMGVTAIDGEIQWRRDLSAIDGPPALDGGLLFVTTHTTGDQGEYQTSILVLDAATGATRLRILPTPPLSTFHGSLAAMGDMLLVEACCSYYAGYRIP